MDCAFWSYYRKTGEKWDDELQVFTYRTFLRRGCEMYRKLTGRHGPVISGTNRACKYWKPSKEREAKMDISDQISSGFIKPEHLDHPERAIIANVAPGRFDRPDMELQDGRTLGLNGTNLRTMNSAWGPLTEEWVGKEIELYVGKTTYNGQERDSVLVRTISPHIAWRSKMGAPAGSQARKKELDDDIPF